MTNQEAVIAVLTKHGCESSREISQSAMRNFKYKISPSTVSGIARNLVRQGILASSEYNGSQVYWLVEK